jgi:oligoendopeptidase F
LPVRATIDSRGDYALTAEPLQSEDCRMIGRPVAHRLMPLIALAVTALPLAVPGATGDDSVPTMWDLSDLFATTEAWTHGFEQTRAAAEKLDAYRGTLGNGADAMFTALDAISAVNRQTDRLGVYAALKGDEDLRAAKEQERRQQAQALGTLIGEKTAWLNPEIVAVGAQKVAEFEGQRRDLKDRFGFLLHDALRAAPHTLSFESESVLAMTGDVLAQPTAVFDELAFADLPYPDFTLPSGQSVRLDEPTYEKYRQVDNRDERKAVFDTFWGAWHKYESTFGANLTAQVMGDVFTAKARHYDNALAAALFQSNMPESVYRTLVAETNAALPTLHRYLKMRKARLGVTDELAYYDNYPPMFPLAEPPTFSVKQSETLTLAALAPMGDDYLALMRKGFAGQWMNVLPHPGKATGAYMNGSAYDVHPYLLLNHHDDYQSLTTLAHEWGHAVHSLLTDAAQPYEKSNYSTFIAESASIGNEMLLNDYMVAHARNKAEKLYYLGVGIDAIRSSFFRQVQFAEFELAIHEEVQQGRPLSGAHLTEMYCGLLKRYYGEQQGIMKIDPAYCIEWAFVPHFYRDFYVWQYATSMAGSAELTDAIIRQGVPARAKFLDMLRAGGSDYPYELYKKVGIDMATPAPYRALVARMNRLMDQVEALEKAK